MPITPCGVTLRLSKYKKRRRYSCSELAIERDEEESEAERKK
jgi:hypothetical protein